MVEGGELPSRLGSPKRLLEPRGLGRVHGVGVEKVQLDRTENATVVAPRHAELVELVAPSLHTNVVVAENSRDGPSPAEPRLPVPVKRGRALGVVVIPECQDQASRVPGLEAANCRPEAARGLAGGPESA